jgi:hypothetical protein
MPRTTRSPWVVAVISLALMVMVESTLSPAHIKPSTGSVGEVPFKEGWPFWHLFLNLLEPGKHRAANALVRWGVHDPNTWQLVSQSFGVTRL